MVVADNAFFVRLARLPAESAYAGIRGAASISLQAKPILFEQHAGARLPACSCRRPSSSKSSGFEVWRPSPRGGASLSVGLG
jgi:hypothetical protein